MAGSGNFIYTSIDGFNSAIKEIMTEFQRDVERAVKRGIKKYVDTDLIPEIQRRAPQRNGAGKRYADGWTSSAEGLVRIVYNSLKPQLTHLLENGHIDFNTGERVGKRSHIRAAYESTYHLLEQRILAELK